MNERITKLEDQCWEDNPNTGPVVFNREKFAELLIKECASIVDNYGRWILYDKLAVKIKQHFGVTYD